MLSNTPQMSGLHSRQRQHRRQKSTPSAFDAVKIGPLPSPTRRPVSHRRGLSLDTRGRPLAPAPMTTLQQEYAPVSIAGRPTTPQHGLRGAQQQRQARSGLGQPIFIEPDRSEGFSLSPQVTPQSRRFAAGMTSTGQLDDLHGLPFDPYSGSMGLFDRSVNRLGDNGSDPSGDIDFFDPGSALSTPSFITFPDSSPAGTCPGWLSETETGSSHSRRSSRRISNGIMDKVAKFEALGNGLDTSRPCTPSNQTGNDYFSQTPIGTAVKQEPATAQPPNRFSEGYDESMEETLKPVRNNRTDNRTSGIFQDLRQQAEAMVHTPPRANTIPMAIPNPGLRTPDFMSMRNISEEFKRIEREFGSVPPRPVDIPPMYSFMKSHNAFADKPELQHPDIDSQKSSPPSPVSKAPSRRSSPHRRTESIASLTSAASIADINIEETKTETGITLEDIAAFIQGPDPSDGKWRCLYEGCNKPFGRKENIKSHVQTHLNDRQYQCPTCKKCFVRQHDLKRHAKIHTGIKPYPCECGNSFARHDALTRHRQRGMCIGAFDGIVRKVVKRGRPKKIRPDMDERRDKAERTRRKNKLSSATSASSQSGYSDVSAANSPSNDFDGLLDDDQFANILAAIPNPPTTMDPTTLAVSTAPIPTSIPGSMADAFSALSPSAISNYSTSHSQPTTTETLPLPARPPTATASATEYNPPPSPAKSIASHASHYTRHTTTTTATTTTTPGQLPNSPPDLSSPRSPPPLLTSASDITDAGDTGDPDPDAHFFDLDSLDRHNSSVLSDASLGLGTTVAAHAASLSSGGISGVTGGGVGGGVGISGMDGTDMLLGFHTMGMGMGMGMAEDMVSLEGGHGGHLHGLSGCHPHHGQVGVGGVMKFEDEFDAVGMFAGGEDVFFGTA